MASCILYKMTVLILNIPVSFYVSIWKNVVAKVDQRCEIKLLIECSSMSVLKWTQNSSVSGVVLEVSYQRGGLILLTALGALIFSRIIGSRWEKQTNRAFTPVPKKEPNEIHLQKKYESIPPPSSPRVLCLSFKPHFLCCRSLPLIHGTQHWHIHNQMNLTLHILPQSERRRLRHELYTQPSLLISCSQHQTP